MIVMIATPSDPTEIVVDPPIFDLERIFVGDEINWIILMVFFCLFYNK